MKTTNFFNYLINNLAQKKIVRIIFKRIDQFTRKNSEDNYTISSLGRVFVICVVILILITFLCINLSSPM